MTGREWYTMGWNAAPMGPSCYTLCAQDGLCTFLQPKAASGRSRILLKRLGVSFYSVDEGAQLLSKLILFKLRGGLIQEPRGRCHAEKQAKAALFNQEKNNPPHHPPQPLMIVSAKEVPEGPGGAWAGRAETKKKPLSFKLLTFESHCVQYY